MATNPMKHLRREVGRLSLRELSQRKLHHHNGRFINPFGPSPEGSPWRVLRWKLFSRNHFKPFYGEETVTPVHVRWNAVREHRGCSVTFLRHASILIKDLDTYFLVDPVFDNIFRIKDFSPLAFDVREMPPPDHILITHGHYDHLDTPSLRRMPGKTHVISPLGYSGVFKALRMTHRTQLDWFDTYKENGREITLLPCSHWTMRNPLLGPNDSLWGSYLFRGASGVTLFVSGDLAAFDRFEELGGECDIDLAVFNLGAYEPRWFMAGSHINPSETVRAFLELKARHLLVVHWGTFRLGDEPVHFPPRDIQREMDRQAIADRRIHLDHGQTLFYGRQGVDIL